jgi:integrase
VFPGANRGKPLSDMAMLELLRGAAGNGYTVHGFRKTHSNWAHDKFGYNWHEAIEHNLAHRVGTKVAQTYRTDTDLKRRAKVMRLWADCCDGKIAADNVVNMRRA